MEGLQGGKRLSREICFRHYHQTLGLCLPALNLASPSNFLAKTQSQRYHWKRCYPPQSNLKETLLLLKNLSRLLFTHTSHEALERKAELSPLETAVLGVQVRTSLTSAEPSGRRSQGQCQAVSMIATGTADHLLCSSNFSGHISRPPSLTFSGAQGPYYLPSSWKTHSPVCSLRGVSPIESWDLPLVPDYITRAKEKRTVAFLPCLDQVLKMAHLLFPHSLWVIPLSQTHVQKFLSLAPRWRSGM